MWKSRVSKMFINDSLCKVHVYKCLLERMCSRTRMRVIILISTIYYSDYLTLNPLLKWNLKAIWYVTLVITLWICRYWLHLMMMEFAECTKNTCRKYYIVKPPTRSPTTQKTLMSQMTYHVPNMAPISNDTPVDYISRI